VNEDVLLWGLLFGSIGIFYFRYGKKSENPVMRYTGVALLLFPYVVQNTIAMVAVGLGLMLLPKLMNL
jgi:hypothetical protein|tara:strand:- start:196 stop:399 length:204 start_codon:yes stop_codon:yes gene_type:complete